MIISEKRKSALYDAIREPIVQKRFDVMKLNLPSDTAEQLDEMMFRLEQNIWREVVKALDISGPH